MISKGSPLLPIVEISKREAQEKTEAVPLSRHARKKAYMATSEERWRQHPQQYLPHRHAIDTLRIDRMWALLNDNLTKKENLSVVDLGCGASPLSPFLAGNNWTYVDSSLTALSGISSGKKIHDALPLTKLDDDQFDLVICTDVIAELFSQDYRLAMGEIARLVKKNGLAMISTNIDIRSEDALERFLALVETEFDLIAYSKSYHRLAIFWLDLLKAPGKWYAFGQQPQKKKDYVDGAHGWLRRGWRKMMTSSMIRPLWKLSDMVFQPCADKIKHSKKGILILEKISLFLWDQEAISHLILVAKRKPLG